MKRIYVCCILLILLVILTAFYGVFTGQAGGTAVEGFQALSTPPTTIKCTKKLVNYTDTPDKSHIYWYCVNKNHADALLAGGANNVKYVDPAHSVCIKGATSTYVCLERDRKDRRYLLNRQKRAVCDFVVKGNKDVDDIVGKAETLRGIAADAINTITVTKPEIAQLKRMTPLLADYLDEKSRTIETQKATLTTFKNSMDVPISDTNTFRNTKLLPIITKLDC